MAQSEYVVTKNGEPVKNVFVVDLSDPPHRAAFALYTQAIASNDPCEAIEALTFVIEASANALREAKSASPREEFGSLFGSKVSASV